MAAFFDTRTQYSYLSDSAREHFLTTYLSQKEGGMVGGTISHYEILEKIG
jgi:hypothetical protein